MENDYMEMNEEELIRMTGEYKKVVDRMAEIEGKLQNKFGNLSSDGLVPIDNAISEQDKIYASGTDYYKGIYEFASEHVNGEKKQASEIQTGMTIPNDFVAENATKISQYNNTLLGKIDGRSVNEGKASEKTDEIDESVIAAENLTDITGNKAKEEKYDDSTVVGNTLLGNINNGDETKEQEYDDNTSISNQKMSNISGNQTEQQDYDDSSSLNSQVQLGNQSGNVTEQQEYEDNVVVGKTLLGNINEDSEEQEKQYIDDKSITKAVESGTVEVKPEEGKKLEQASNEAFPGNV